MVFFTCNHCGESLQKPKVERHYAFQCRRPKSLTCVDCFKDFNEEEYVVHTKCLTEEERYSAKGSIPGGIIKKGDVKQESWLDMIKRITVEETNLRPPIRNLLNNIAGFLNVPRKKPKFINFIKSSTGGRVNLQDIEEAWNIIEKHKSKVTTAQNGTSAKSVNKIENNAKRKPTENGTEAKKIKLSDSSEEININKFSFKGKILEIVSMKGPISSKKLQKKVLNAYKKQMEIDEISEETIKKYNKKLKKVGNIVINNGIVSLNCN